MKSRCLTETFKTEDLDSLRSAIKFEKEALVSMFLTNASVSDLSLQFKLISDLNARISAITAPNDRDETTRSILAER